MDKNYLVKFRQRIRELRQKTGLSQEKFALMIGMDRTYFSSVESGKRNISLLNIKKIADGLEITVDKLFENYPHLPQFLIMYVHFSLDNKRIIACLYLSVIE